MNQGIMAERIVLTLLHFGINGKQNTFILNYYLII